MLNKIAEMFLAEKFESYVKTAATENTYARPRTVRTARARTRERAKFIVAPKILLCVGSGILYQGPFVLIVLPEGCLWFQETTAPHARMVYKYTYVGYYNVPY